MKNMKFLTVPLTALALWGFTACAKIEPQKVEFGEGYRIESRVKDSQVRMYKDGDLVAKKTIIPDNTPVYEFFDKADENLYRKFAEAKLHSEIVYLKDKRGEPIQGAYGTLEADIPDDAWGKSISVPLWEDFFSLEEDKVQGRKLHFYPSWEKAYGLFIDFLNGERLLEKKYNKDF